MTGSLPSELGLLEDLNKIFIWNEPSVTGTLPDTLQNLKQLTYIDFTVTGLSGSLPNWIDQWSSMTFFSFSKNQLTGSFPDALLSMTNLAILAVDDNFMTGDISLLDDLVELTGLYLDDNGFTGTLDTTFLQDLKNLRVLDISSNNFGGQVPVHLMALSSLKTMDVHGNELSVFPDSIATSRTLTFLAIHDNPISGSFPTTTVQNLEALKHLDLTATQFSGKIPTEIGGLSQLTYLFMAGTNFTKGTIPTEFASLTNLVDLSLKASRRTGVRI